LRFAPATLEAATSVNCLSCASDRGRRRGQRSRYRGSIDNAGAIINTRTVTPPSDVTVHDYLLAVHANGGSGDPADLQVYATTLADAISQYLPCPPGPATFAAGLPTPPALAPRLTTSCVFGTGNGPTTVTFFAS
jgi:hypothetical protein